MNEIERSLNRLPLCAIIDRIERRSLRQRTMSDEVNAPTQAMLDELLGAWTYSRNPECLARALFRYSWLRRRGIRGHLVLGAHIPTDRMHSWVEINGGDAVGEEPDDMLCYQGLVRFFPRCRRLDASV
ncbi:MAG TPA: lasso peptide biosynthesis B2 protein [Candidatus Elarobacter sp.]|nr:lasso peptide biosynthesis B2 protein [Candidatus Elarobacter sp.]